MKRLTTISLLAAIALFAGIAASEERSATPEEHAQLWATITSAVQGGSDAISSLDRLPFPQAQGVVTATSLHDTRTFRIGFVSLPFAAETCFASRMVLPDAQEVKMTSYCFLPAGTRGTIALLDLWNGTFPHAWIPGPYRFEMFMFSRGHVSRAATTVFVGSQGLSGPVVRSISATETPTGPVVSIGGNFPQFGTVAVVNGVGATVSAHPFGALVVTPAGNLFPGENIVTLCVGGECTTRIVHYQPATGAKG